MGGRARTLRHSFVWLLYLPAFWSTLKLKVTLRQIPPTAALNVTIRDFYYLWSQPNCVPLSPAYLWMDTGAASPSSSVLVGPSSSLWRLADRRNRKAGSANIFSSVNLRQLQRLFSAAGDQDAEQRAQLIWSHRGEAELAQALIGLRARSQRRGLRTNGRDALGSHWLRAFNHLRIGESSLTRHGKDAEEESDYKSEPRGSQEPHRHSSVRAPAQENGAKLALTENQGAKGASERPAKSSSGLRRGGDPERYLHRILH